jgi:hypothetical protein
LLDPEGDGALVSLLLDGLIGSLVELNRKAAAARN